MRFCFSPSKDSGLPWGLVLRLGVHQNCLRSIVSTDTRPLLWELDLVGVGWGPGIWVSNKLPEWFLRHTMIVPPRGWVWGGEGMQESSHLNLKVCISEQWWWPVVFLLSRGDGKGIQVFEEYVSYVSGEIQSSLLDYESKRSKTHSLAWWCWDESRALAQKIISSDSQCPWTKVAHTNCAQGEEWTFGLWWLPCVTSQSSRP